MLYRNLGKSGIKVSEISLGTWMTDLTGSAQEDEAKKKTSKKGCDCGCHKSSEVSKKTKKNRK